MTAAFKKPIWPRLAGFVPLDLRETFQQRVVAGDFQGALWLVNSGARVPIVRKIWRRIPVTQQATVLAEAISSGEFLWPSLPFLVPALRGIRERGERAFDSDTAQERFSQLPELITAYRGTVQREIDLGVYGISWTLDRERALWFGKRNSLFNRLRATPVLLTVTVARNDASGLLLLRSEDELLIEPEYTVGAASEIIDGAALALLQGGSP